MGNVFFLVFSKKNLSSRFLKVFEKALKIENCAKFVMAHAAQSLVVRSYYYYYCFFFFFTLANVQLVKRDIVTASTVT